MIPALDLTREWTGLTAYIADTAKQYPRSQLSVCIQVDGGTITHVAEPTSQRIEPGNKPLPQGVSWFSVVRRLRSVVPQDGRYLLQTAVMVDEQGNPIVWTDPTIIRVTGKKW